MVSAQNTYKNPVINEDCPDPSIQRDKKDGYFYLYGTGCKTLKSRDLVHWSKMSNSIGRPTWNDSTYVKDGKTVTDYYSFWACDVSWLDGKYYMQYACALWGNGSRTGVGVAVGDNLTKFTDKGKLFRSTEIGVENSIDPCFYQEKDKKYIIWGSFNDICIAELEDDGLKVKNFTPLNNPNSNPDKTRFSGATKIAGGAFEGPMIYKHGKYYYLFASIGSCCEGAKSTYKTVVGRATSLKGPYLSKTGGDMKYNNYTVIIQGNSRWAGPGHNSEIITDDEGQDWILYHSYDKKEIEETGNDRGRLVLMDKIEWVNDWPVVTGTVPSADERPAPVFYTGDGANMTYRLNNEDLSMSNFKYWNLTTEGACTAKSSIGTGTNVFAPFGSVTTSYTQSGATFDLSQSVGDMKNGLYELKVQTYSKGNNADLYVNRARTAVSKYESVPGSDATTHTRLLTGEFTQSVYGIVTNGKLTIGACSNAPMTTSDRFALANVRIIFREKNVEAAKALTEAFNHTISNLDKEKRSYYKTYLTRLLGYNQTATTTTSDSERYSMLQKQQNTLDSLYNSIELYDSLHRQTDFLESEIARAGADATESARQALAEAKEVYAKGSMTDKEVNALIKRLLEEARNMFYVYKEGDGTAEHPYVIRTPEQLDHMHDVLVKNQMIYFELGADIDMKNIEWAQLNGSAVSYGYWINFDGKGHLIFNLHNAADEKLYPSFFGTLCGECRNVGFVDADIKCNNATGGAIIAGAMGNSSFKDAEGTLLPVVIENCYVTGAVTGKGYLGAISGNLASSPIVIRNVYSAANVTGDYSSSNIAGGLVGRIRIDFQMENSYAAGNVTGTTSGGIIGGGQATSTKPSVFTNAFAWNFKVDGTTASELGSFRVGKDEMTEVCYFDEMQLNGSPVSDGSSSWQLRQKAATWGSPWHKDTAAGNGRPILEWQYARGDYKEYCGFDESTAIEGIAAPDKSNSIKGMFDLSGRRVNNITKRGIYIVDGKKIIR